MVPQGHAFCNGCGNMPPVAVCMPFGKGKGKGKSGDEQNGMASNDSHMDSPSKWSALGRQAETADSELQRAPKSHNKKCNAGSKRPAKSQQKLRKLGTLYNWRRPQRRMAARKAKQRFQIAKSRISLLAPAS